MCVQKLPCVHIFFHCTYLLFILDTSYSATISYMNYSATISNNYFNILQEGGKFNDNKEIAVALGKRPELKKYMKKAMPFVMLAKVRQI